jgi:hypothetical protein
MVQEAESQKTLFNLVSGMYGYRDHVGIRLADYQHGPDCVYLEQVHVFLILSS